MVIQWENNCPTPWDLYTYFFLCSSVLFSFFLPHSNRLYYEIYYCFRVFVHCVVALNTNRTLRNLYFNLLLVNCKLKYAMFNIRIGFHDLRVLEVLFTVLLSFWICEVHSLVLAEWEFYMRARNYILLSLEEGVLYMIEKEEKRRVTGLF